MSRGPPRMYNLSLYIYPTSADVLILIIIISRGVVVVVYRFTARPRRKTISYNISVHNKCIIYTYRRRRRRRYICFQYKSEVIIATRLISAPPTRPGEGRRAAAVLARDPTNCFAISLPRSPSRSPRTPPPPPPRRALTTTLAADPAAVRGFHRFSVPSYTPPRHPAPPPPPGPEFRYEIKPY